MDGSVLVCVPTSTAKRICLGSIALFCFKCGIEVWVSQSGQKQIERDPTTRIMCLQCMMEANPEPGQIGIVEGAIDELKMQP